MHPNGIPAVNIQNDLANHQTSLEVAFQPILETDSLNLAGFEALLRVVSEDTMVSTSQYLNKAAHSSDIERLDRWVIEESVFTFSEWHEKYHQPLFLNINISETTLARADFPGFLQYVLLQHFVYSENLSFEIDAHYLANPDCVANIAVLAELGVKFTLNLDNPDDNVIADKAYGITSCKISANLLTQEAENQAFIKVLETSSQKGLLWIATNVETSAAVRQCVASGVPYFQGYFSAKPLPKSDFECWFLTQNLSA